MRQCLKLPKSPISWVGSKTRLAQWILSLMPRHRHYIEPFAGSLAVLFAKPRSKMETVNDANGDLVNFWLQCRDHGNEIVNRLSLIPFSRELFERWRSESPEDLLERAVRWFYLQCSSINGMRRSWSYLRQAGSVSVPPAAQFWSRLNRISPIMRRLQGVSIEHGDYTEMIDRYGTGAGNFLYLDPPYIGVSDYYGLGFSEADHRRLAGMVKGCSANIAISYYECELTEELYPDWRRSFHYGKSSASTGRGNAAAMRKEMLLMNYDGR